MALGWRKDYLRYKTHFLDIYNVYKQRKDLKMFLELLLTLVAVSFFAAFALKPTILTIIDLVREINKKEETVVKLDTKIQNLQQAQFLFTQESTRIKLLETAIPEKPGPDRFVRQIEGVTGGHPVNLLGVSINEMTLLGEEKIKKRTGKVEELPGNAGGVSFSTSIKGDYQNIIGFFSDLENMRRPIKTDSISLLSSTGEDGSLILAISGRTPYLKKD